MQTYLVTIGLDFESRSIFEEEGDRLAGAIASRFRVDEVTYDFEHTLELNDPTAPYFVGVVVPSSGNTEGSALNKAMRVVESLLSRRGAHFRAKVSMGPHAVRDPNQPIVPIPAA